MRILPALLLLFSAGAFAQIPRGFFPWWDSPLTGDLNLTEDQREQIRSIVRDYRGRLIDQRAALEKAEAEVEDLFNDEKADERRASEIIDRLNQARGDLTRSFTLMSLKLRSVLSADQWRDLQRKRSERQQRFRGPGRPGPGGGPGLRQPGQPRQPGEPRDPRPPGAPGPDA